MNQCCLPSTQHISCLFSWFIWREWTSSNECIKTQPLKTCRGWRWAVCESRAHPWLISLLWGLVYRAGFISEFHKCQGFSCDMSLHQRETNRMNIGPTFLSAQHRYLCSLTSFLHPPLPPFLLFLPSESDMLQGARRLIWIPNVPQLVFKIWEKKREAETNARHTLWTRLCDKTDKDRWVKRIMSAVRQRDFVHNLVMENKQGKTICVVRNNRVCECGSTSVTAFHVLLSETWPFIVTWADRPAQRWWILRLASTRREKDKMGTHPLTLYSPLGLC